MPASSRTRRRSRGVPPALADHELLVTRDPAAAQLALSQIFGETLLVIEPDALDGFELRLHGARCGAVSMIYVGLGCAAALVVQATTDSYLVHSPTGREARFEIRGEEIDASVLHPLITNPGDGYVQRLQADGPELVVAVERHALLEQLARMLGTVPDKPLAFAHRADFSSASAARWHSAIALLSGELIAPDSLLRQAVGAQAVEELIISTLLYVQPSGYFDRLRTRGQARRRTVVQQALEYIDAHLAEQIRLPEIATHVGVAVRTLQVGFQDDMESTVVAYIRDRRLINVRRMLLETSPRDHLTVARAASRWGFNNPGTFAVYYRNKFGETPSQTLSRE